MALSTRTTAQVTATRHHRAPRLGGRPHQPRSLGSIATTYAEHCTEQSGLTEIWLSVPQRTRGEITCRWFNRRMRKTARPVVWEGGRAQSRPLDPIREVRPTKLDKCYLAPPVFATHSPFRPTPCGFFLQKRVKMYLSDATFTGEINHVRWKALGRQRVTSL